MTRILNIEMCAALAAWLSKRDRLLSLKSAGHAVLGMTRASRRSFPLWLSEGVTSARFSSSFVIDFEAARKRSRPAELQTSKRPKILDTLDRGEEAVHRLKVGSVKQADLARKWGLTPPRITQLVKLGRLSPAVRTWIRANADALEISENKLRPILKFPEERQMAALLEAADAWPRKTDGRRGTRTERPMPRIAKG
jgi:hypothetical protein